MGINKIHVETTFEESREGKQDSHHRTRYLEKNQELLKVAQPYTDAAHPIINASEQCSEFFFSTFSENTRILSSSAISQNFFGIGSKKITAEEMSDQLISLEDKLMQLCFVSTAAVYETELQDLEVMVEAWKISGFIFHSGDIVRQRYLMESCAQVAQIPLLFGHDFAHSWHSYYDGTKSLEEFSSEDFYLLGRSFSQNNLINNVQIQCEMDIEKVCSINLGVHYNDFLRGVKEGGGILGSHMRVSRNSLCDDFFNNSSLPVGIKLDPLQNPFFSNLDKPLKNEKIIFCDLTSFDQDTDYVIESLRGDFDAFLLPFNLEPAVRFLGDLVQSRKITPSFLERAIKKILKIKEKFSLPSNVSK